jgi:mycothiol synthase
MDDLASAVSLFNACSLDLLGVKKHDAHDQAVEWKTPLFNLDTDTRVIISNDGKLVGYAEVWDTRKPHVSVHSGGRVHPDYLGLGIGSFLLQWEEQRAHLAIDKAPAEAKVTLSQFVNSKDKRSQALLSKYEYRLVRHFYRMEIDLAESGYQAQWPDGITVRGFDPSKDLEPTIMAVRDAFKDHWGDVDAPFEEEMSFWKHWITTDDNFDPSLWFLAIEKEEIVGMALCWPKETEDPQMGWVDILGVRRPWRRRGVAVALLNHLFAEFVRRGKKRVGLGVDATSLTGANRVYERAGMRPTRQDDLYEKDLRPGIDLRRQALEA